jgi:hypothetical protein
LRLLEVSAVNYYEVPEHRLRNEPRRLSEL